MIKRKQLSIAVSMLCSSAAMAQSIEGVVVDSAGNVIRGAHISIVGSKQQAVTNQTGQFQFGNAPDGKVELHVSASGFAHFNQHLSANTEGNVTITLNRSPIEVIDIKATPFHASLMESATPVSVLSGEALRQQQAATLGDTLEKQVGVHTNFHAGVASTPIIRGLSGPRVLIAQNGLDVSDVSRVGPDHSVATEASTAQQIEVLRGPATLFFGSGAIGGVVNVVDERVPTNNQKYAEVLLENSSVNDQKLGAFNFKTGTESVAFYADGFWRESDDYRIPEPSSAGESSSHEHTVENSAEESKGFTLGSSYLLDNGFIGLSVGQLNREYGIPGHSHGEEEEHEAHEETHADESRVFADLEQTRYQLIGEFNFDSGFLSAVNLKGSYTDYQHSEIEAGTVGTRFSNDTSELRVDFLHHPIANWRGGLSFHVKDSDMEAVGAEAFTPPSSSTTVALALMEERHFDDVLVQLGARVERVTIDANNVKLPSIDAHAHDDEHHEEDEHDHGGNDEHEASQNVTRIFDAEHQFTPVTLSAGLVWDFTKGYNVGVSFTRSERAPSAAELLSFGPHIGTRTYEVGALFALQDGSSNSIGLSNQEIDLETANNIDLTFRKTQGDLAIIVNGFYNQVDNYYYQIATGLFASDGHDHHGHAHEHEAAGELPVYLFQADDVILHGFEAQIVWQANEQIKTSVFSDFVRARLKSGGDLPRTPPLRFGATLAYEYDGLHAHLDVTRYQTQDKVASLETPTDGYTLIDAGVSYQLPLEQYDISLYANVKNLTDSYAQVHSSFVKNIAPRQGRNIAVGLRAYF